MSNLYFFSLILLPISFYFPYHLSFYALVLGGVIHLYSEITYLSTDKNIFRKRKSYPPIIGIGAMILASFGLGFYLNPNDSFEFHSNILNYFNLGIVIYFFISSFPVLIKYNLFKNQLFLFLYLLILIIGSILGFYFPIVFGFLLIHLHNIFPWIFFSNKYGKKYLIHGFIISVLLPFVTLSYFTTNDFKISELSLSLTLEIDLYEHVVPSLIKFPSELFLLSWFGYSQAIHYYLWIVLIPSNDLRSRFTDFIYEVFLFLGISNQPKKWYIGIVYITLAISFALFYFYPVGWRRLYFLLSSGHVYFELPLLILVYVEDYNSLLNKKSI
jgi:hypothetical protein